MNSCSVVSSCFWNSHTLAFFFFRFSEWSQGDKGTRRGFSQVGFPSSFNLIMRRINWIFMTVTLRCRSVNHSVLSHTQPLCTTFFTVVCKFNRFIWIHYSISNTSDIPTVAGCHNHLFGSLKKKHTLQGTNMSHLGKRKIIFKSALVGYMLVLGSVILSQGRFFRCPNIQSSL